MATDVAPATLRSAPSVALGRCVGDIDVFLAEHWAQRPLLRQSTGETFDDLLSLADIDYIISSTALRSPAFRLVKAGKAIDVSSYTRYGSVGPQSVYDMADTGRIYDLIADGATIALQGLQNFWLPLTRFCRDLELALTHFTQTNAYITPAGSQGLGIHYDTHDVFVLQVSGRKHWEVYGCRLEYPLQSQTSPILESVDEPALISTVLQPGDCLYIPRGYLHEAYSLDEVSAHLTVGILSYTWRELLQEVFNETVNEIAFRAPLPAGFARENGTLRDALAERVHLLQEWLATVDLEPIGERFTQRFWQGCTPVLAGQLQQLQLLDKLTDATLARRRPECICLLRVSDATLTATLADRALEMPAELENVMRRIVDGGPFAIGDLADDLDDDSRLVLVRRLMREGLVEVIAL